MMDLEVDGGDSMKYLKNSQIFVNSGIETDINSNSYKTGEKNATRKGTSGAANLFDSADDQLLSGITTSLDTLSLDLEDGSKTRRQEQNTGGHLGNADTCDTSETCKSMLERGPIGGVPVHHNGWNNVPDNRFRPGYTLTNGCLYGNMPQGAQPYPFESVANMKFDSTPFVPEQQQPAKFRRPNALYTDQISPSHLHQNFNNMNLQHQPPTASSPNFPPNYTQQPPTTNIIANMALNLDSGVETNKIDSLEEFGDEFFRIQEEPVVPKSQGSNLPHFQPPSNNEFTWNQQKPGLEPRKPKENRNFGRQDETSVLCPGPFMFQPPDDNDRYLSEFHRSRSPIRSLPGMNRDMTLPHEFGYYDTSPAQSDDPQNPDTDSLDLVCDVISKDVMSQQDTCQTQHPQLAQQQQMSGSSSSMERSLPKPLPQKLETIGPAQGSDQYQCFSPPFTAVPCPNSYINPYGTERQMANTSVPVDTRAWPVSTPSPQSQHYLPSSSPHQAPPAVPPRISATGVNDISITQQQHFSQTDPLYMPYTFQQNMDHNLAGFAPLPTGQMISPGRSELLNNPSPTNIHRVVVTSQQYVPSSHARTHTFPAPYMDNTHRQQPEISFMNDLQQRVPEPPPRNTSAFHKVVAPTSQCNNNYQHGRSSHISPPPAQYPLPVTVAGMIQAPCSSAAPAVPLHFSPPHTGTINTSVQNVMPNVMSNIPIIVLAPLQSPAEPKRERRILPKPPGSQMPGTSHNGAGVAIIGATGSNASNPPLPSRNATRKPRKGASGKPPPKLVQARSKIDELSKQDLLRKDGDGDQYLHLAVCRKEIRVHFVKAILERLQKEGLQQLVDEKNNKGQTPLYLATMLNLHSIVGLLIEFKANVDIQVQYVGSGGSVKETKAPIHIASSKGKEYLRTLKTLLENRTIFVDILTSMGRTALRCAVDEHGEPKSPGSSETISSIEIVKTLVKFGADPFFQDNPNRKTALMYAIEKGSLDMVKTILDSCDSKQKAKNLINMNDAKGDTCMNKAEALKDSGEMEIWNLLNEKLHV